MQSARQSRRNDLPFLPLFLLLASWAWACTPDEQEPPSPTPPLPTGLGESDRHALHGGPDAKGEGVRELRAGLTTLLVIGETKSAPYREILAELALVGGDAAASLVLEFMDHPRMRFEEKEVACAEFFRSLLASGTLREERERVQRALAELEAPPR